MLDIFHLREVKRSWLMMLAINIELGLHAGVGRNRAAVCCQAWMLMLGHPEVAEAAQASWVLINCENLFTLFCSQPPKVMAITYFQKNHRREQNIMAYPILFS